MLPKLWTAYAPHLIAENASLPGFSLMLWLLAVMLWSRIAIERYVKSIKSSIKNSGQEYVSLCTIIQLFSDANSIKVDRWVIQSTPH
jgi:hypothetical protein